MDGKLAYTERVSALERLDKPVILSLSRSGSILARIEAA
jgi:hypothetical protein